MNESELIFPYPAKVLRVDTRSPDLLALAKESHAFDPTIFEERAPFFWTAEISNSQVDAYFTHMLDSTLNNFATEAQAGVAFLNSHRHNELPIGRSLAGRMISTGSLNSVQADFFTLPGLNLNGLATDEFIAGVRSGIVSDISVGFHGGKMWCDICKQDYRSWDCPHMAGMKYDVQGSETGVMATVGIDGAHLAEVSAVYDGATPDATILKAQRMVEAGELKPDAVRMLEARYRMKFDNKRSYAGISIPERKVKLELEQIVNQVREVLAIDANADVAGAVLSVTGERDRLRTEAETATKEAETLRAKVTELTPQAADGVAYRNDLVAEALVEGVRAYGDKFNQAMYENVLRTSALDVVKQLKSDWGAVGSSRFPGGRKTVDDGAAPETAKTPRKPYVPEAAYKS
jgi:hypothetical protein